MIFLVVPDFEPKLLFFIENVFFDMFVENIDLIFDSCLMQV